MDNPNRTSPWTIVAIVLSTLALCGVSCCALFTLGMGGIGGIAVFLRNPIAIQQAPAQQQPVVGQPGQIITIAPPANSVAPRSYVVICTKGNIGSETVEEVHNQGTPIILSCDIPRDEIDVRWDGYWSKNDGYLAHTQSTPPGEVVSAGTYYAGFWPRAK